MKIYSVYDAEFARYGRVHSGMDGAALLREMERIPLPESGTAYEPSVASLEACEAFADYQASAFGGMPVQLGMCWGRNTKLNCLEYHRDSEFNLGLGDFILLLAKQDEIENGSSRCRAERIRQSPRCAASRRRTGILPRATSGCLHTPRAPRRRTARPLRCAAKTSISPRRFERARQAPPEKMISISFAPAGANSARLL